MLHLAAGPSRRWMQPATAAALDAAADTLEFSVPLDEDGPATGDVAARGVPVGLVHAVGRFDAARSSRRCRSCGPPHPRWSRGLQRRDRDRLRRAPGRHRRRTGVLGARYRRVPRRRRSSPSGWPSSRRSSPTPRCPMSSSGQGQVWTRSNRFRPPSPRRCPRPCSRTRSLPPSTPEAPPTPPAR